MQLENPQEWSSGAAVCHSYTTEYRTSPLAWGIILHRCSLQKRRNPDSSSLQNTQFGIIPSIQDVVRPEEGLSSAEEGSSTADEALLPDQHPPQCVLHRCQEITHCVPLFVQPDRMWTRRCEIAFLNTCSVRILYRVLCEIFIDVPEGRRDFIFPHDSHNAEDKEGR